MNGESPRSQLTRRRLLKIAAAGTASVGVGSFLAACAAPATTSSPTPAATTPGATTTPLATPTKSLEKVSLMTAFLFSGSDAPWFLARERGYFAAEGLDVEMIPQGSGSATTARLVGAGSATFGVVDGGVVINAVGAGIPIKAVLGFFQTGASAAIVRRDSGITTPRDLEGKTLDALTGSAVTNLFPGWMRLNGADPNKVTVRTQAPTALRTAFIRGESDGLLTFILSLPVVRAAGVDAVGILYSDFGFNIPGNSLVANALTIRDRPELVRAFATAAQKGLEDSVKEPEAALDALVKAVPDLAPQRAALADSIATQNPLTRTERTQGKTLGWMSNEDWREAIDLLEEYGGLGEVPKVEDVIVNFIPES